MPALGRVLFWACVATGVIAAGGSYFIGLETGGLFILGGMVVVGLVLRWVFSGGGHK